VGAHRAESLTGRCEPVDAREAVRIGLVDEHAFVTKRPSSSTRDTRRMPHRDVQAEPGRCLSPDLAGAVAASVVQ
jgi:enoyl-CoA hydratase/carnithine racemase